MKTKPTIMRVVSGQCILAVAVIAALVLHPALPARGGALTWHFSVIAEAGVPAAFGGAAINASGEVAFTRVENINTWDQFLGQDSVCKGVVGSVETVADTWGAFDRLFGGSPTINDLGDVAFGARHGLGHTVVVRYTEATQGYTYIAEANTNDPNTFFSRVDAASINNSGTVAFTGTIADTDDRFVAVGNGGTVGYVDVLAYEDNWGYGSVMIQRAGPTLEVAWGSHLGAPVITNTRIEKGGSFNHTTIAEGNQTSPQFLEVSTQPSINNLGYVSFSAELAGGGQAVYYSSGGPSFLVADTSGEFDGFQTTAISNNGIAFYGWLDYAGTSGVFTGPNALADKVLTIGDTIAGIASPVVAVHLNPHGMNNSGQIALSVQFADGTQRIIRADPYILQQIPEGLLAVSVLKTALFSTIFQAADTSGGGQEGLSFDYAFPTTTGQLVVTLGGVEVARIDAPVVLADGFTTFETLVDLDHLFPGRPDELLLEFTLNAGSDTTGLYLDNIDFAVLANGNFATGNLEGWQASYAEGGGAGVSVDPFYIPEPATLALLLLGGLALLRRRRA